MTRRRLAAEIDEQHIIALADGGLDAAQIAQLPSTGARLGTGAQTGGWAH